MDGFLFEAHGLGGPAISRLGSAKLPISSQLELVLPDFRDFAGIKPISDRRRSDTANSCDFGLCPKVFKKVVRCHGEIISHALRNTQAISNAESDKLLTMTTWHDRLEQALKHREKTWADLFDYMSVKPANLKKPSVYAWKPGATKRSTMMDASNAALVCKFLDISPMWLFHNEGSIDGEDNELMTAINKMTKAQKAILTIGLNAGQKKKDIESRVFKQTEQSPDRLDQK
jgi:hypothetical protein